MNLTYSLNQKIIYSESPSKDEGSQSTWNYPSKMPFPIPKQIFGVSTWKTTRLCISTRDKTNFNPKKISVLFLSCFC